MSPRFGSNPDRKPKLVTDGMDPLTKLAYFEERASRRMVLRPWIGECLRLRAGDKRIEGIPAAWRNRLGAGYARRIHRAAALPRGRYDAKAIGLPAALADMGNRDSRTVSVELVRISARLLERVCRWPELPENCSVKEAAQLFGVDFNTITLWCKAGKLVRERVVGSGKRCKNQRWTVRYVETDPVLRRFHGQRYKRPEWSHRLMCPEPDAAWAAGRFRGKRRVEWAVRVTENLPGAWQRAHPKRFWRCPVCGRRSRLLYLPAGPMARKGRTWASWRWQCRECTGAEPEQEAWSGQLGDPFSRWILKLTCGRVSGNEFRVALDYPPDEKDDLDD